MTQQPPQPPRRPDVTVLLDRARRGDRQATNDLFPVVYEELRALAQRHLANERSGHTLQPTALVNEAYLRLIGPEQAPWENRAHFFGAAAQAIRRILTDHARAKASQKRGGDRQRVALDEVAEPTLGPGGGPESAFRELGGVDVIGLDDALTRLAGLDEQKARVVELRFFAGLTAEQTALALGISERTVAREWQFARAWLHRELSKEGQA